MNQADQARIQDFLDKKYRYSKSSGTKNTYNTYLTKFHHFINENYKLSLDEMIHKVTAKKIDSVDVLDKFYTFLSNQKKKNGKSLSNASVKLGIIVAKEFLNSQGLHVYNEDMRQRFRLPKKESVYEEGLTKEIIVRLLHNSSPKLQTAILMCASSGMRVGELTQLRTSDIDFTSNPTTIHLRRETTKTKEPRIICISSEATKTLLDYLKRYLNWTEQSTDDYYLYLPNDKNYDNLDTYEKAVVSTKISLIQTLGFVTNSIPELAKKNENGRNAIHFHSLRAWFKTQVTDAHESDFAEALMGHKSLKLVYYRQNSTARTKIYQKVESALTVSDFDGIEKNLKEMSDRQKELEEMVIPLVQYAKEQGIQIPSFFKRENITNESIFH